MQEQTGLGWCQRISVMAVHALLVAQIVKKQDFDRAVAIVAEEIRARLSLGDRPN